MRIKTREITKELKEKGIKYNQYNARIKWVAKKLNIEPKRIGNENTYLRSEANQIIKYIKKGYKQVGRPAKKEMNKLNSYNYLYTKWEDAYKIVENAYMNLGDKYEELKLENEYLKKEIQRLTEKRKKFWFFK